MKKQFIYKLRDFAVKLVLVMFAGLVLWVVLIEIVWALSADKYPTRQAVHAGATTMFLDISQRRQEHADILSQLEYQTDTLKDNRQKVRQLQFINQAQLVHKATTQLLDFMNTVEQRQSQVSNLQGDFISTSRRRDYFRAEPETDSVISRRVQAYLKQFLAAMGNHTVNKQAPERYLYMQKLATMPAADFHEQFYNKRFIYTQNAGVRVLQSQVVEMESNYLHMTKKAIKKADTF